MSFSNQMPVFVSPLDNQSICSAYFLVQIKLWMSMSGNRRLSSTRVLKRCHCAGTSCTFENEWVFPGQVHSAASCSTQWGPGLGRVHSSSREQAWLCIKARLLSSSPLCSPSSCSDVSSSVSLFLPASALTSLFLPSAGNHVEEREKDLFPSLSLL